MSVTPAQGLQMNSSEKSPRANSGKPDLVLEAGPPSPAVKLRKPEVRPDPVFGNNFRQDANVRPDKANGPSDSCDGHCSTEDGRDLEAQVPHIPSAQTAEGKTKSGFSIFKIALLSIGVVILAVLFWNRHDFTATQGPSSGPSAARRRMGSETKTVPYAIELAKTVWETLGEGIHLKLNIKATSPLTCVTIDTERNPIRHKTVFKLRGHTGICGEYVWGAGKNNPFKMTFQLGQTSHFKIVCTLYSDYLEEKRTIVSCVKPKGGEWKVNTPSTTGWVVTSMSLERLPGRP